MYTVILIALYFFVFGILGVFLFRGTFWSCNDGSVAARGACVGSFESIGGNLVLPRVWANPPYSFDDTISAMRTLLEILSCRCGRPGLTDVIGSRDLI